MDLTRNALSLEDVRTRANLYGLLPYLRLGIIVVDPTRQ